MFPAGREDKLTDASGRFEITWDIRGWPADRTQFYLFARHEALNLAAAVEINPGAGAVELKLQPAAAVSGRVIDTDGKPMSLLDAAVHLLSLGTGDPMRCKDIVDLAVAPGLWTPGEGKTPANSLHAAIQREIKIKGDTSRFVKTDRGKFALAGKS